MLPALDVPQVGILRQNAEQKNSLPDPYRRSSEDQSFDQTCPEESLDGDSTVDAEMPGAAGGKFRDDLGRVARDLFYDTVSGSRHVERPAAENHHPFSPYGQSQEVRTF